MMPIKLWKYLIPVMIVVMALTSVAFGYEMVRRHYMREIERNERIIEEIERRVEI